MSIRVTRSAQASWQGTVPEGGGRIALGSGAFEGPFTLRARVEDVERATNPEELIGAAEAGCFTMSLANLLSEAGHPPRRSAHDRARPARAARRRASRSRGSSSTTVGDVPGVDAATFERLAEQAKATCPVSRALAGTEITLEATLRSASRDRTVAAPRRRC